MKTLTDHEARRHGLAPLTTGYRPDESGMLETVVSDCRRSGRDFALVRDPAGMPEVWIRPIPGFNPEAN